MGGETFNLEDNDKILTINSPKNRVDGPYVVVHKDVCERWAIVAFDWDGDPSLGIRWFHRTKGYPLSRSYPTWLVITPSLRKYILAGLPIDHAFSSNVEKFLAGDMSGDELKSKYGADRK